MLNWQRIPRTSVFWLVLVQWVLALEWLKSGLMKFTQPGYMQNIATTINAMIDKTKFDWYGDILKAAEPTVWGNLTRYSEVTVGLVILLGGWHILKATRWSKHVLAILMAALYLGAFMNVNFYLAAGWNSQAVVGINLVMGFTQAVLATHYLVALRK